MVNNTSSHSTDDDTCTACKKPATILTECDHCSHWFCDSCNGLTPDIVSNMTALSEAGLSWFCTTCRSIPRPLNKSFTNSSSQTLSQPPQPPPPTHPLHLLSKFSPLAQHPLLTPHLTPHPLLSLLTHIQNITLPKPKPPFLTHHTENPYLPYSPTNLTN